MTDEELAAGRQSIIIIFSRSTSEAAVTKGGGRYMGSDAVLFGVSRNIRRRPITSVAACINAGRACVLKGNEYGVPGITKRNREMHSFARRGTLRREV